VSELILEIAPGSLPAEAPTWQDITEHLRGYRFERGRTGWLERFDAGTAEVSVDAGAHLDGLKLRRALRIRRRR
jgi:hypothetical protein